MWQRLGVRILLIGAGYYVAARLSLLLALVEENVTPFWPPTGIAVVGFMTFGGRIWPAILGSAFLVNLPISPTPLSAAEIAAGNCLAPLAAMYLLRWCGFNSEIARLRDALSIVFVALASTLISASVGSASLTLSGAIPDFELLQSWSVWWTGDAMGILVVAPLLWTLRSMRWRAVVWKRLGEAAALFAILATGSILILTTAQPVWVLLFPLLGLIAWRYRRQGAAPAAFLVSTVATWAAVQDRGPFATTDLVDKMLGLQVFNASVSLISLFLATLVSERARALEALEGGFEREHRIAETLQQSLLPDRLPDLPDIAVAARYVATTDVKVGGDWYDALSLPDGRLAIAIGDVAGHGTAAAATMGQLRMASRAYALEGYSPSDALTKLNDLLIELHPSEMATLLYLHVDPESGAYRVASAGHPPPLVVTSDGDAQFVDGGLGPPVGSSPHAHFVEAFGRLAPECMLVLYTDGLVERRRTPIDDGLRQLTEVARSAPHDPDTFCDYVIEQMLGRGVRDDVAVLAIRRSSLAAGPLRITKPAVPRSVPELRRVLRRWLVQHDAGENEVFSILVAACEACTNVIEHAYGPDGGSVRLDASILEGEAVITVGDDGRWLPPRPDEIEPRGRGFVLMRGSMDAVDVTSGNEGTEVRMRKRLRGVTVDA